MKISQVMLVLLVTLSSLGLGQANDCEDMSVKTCRARNSRQLGCFWNRRQRACDQHDQVLFVGNSYTVFRGIRPKSDMPNMFRVIARTNRVRVTSASITAGSATFQRHSGSITPGRISERTRLAVVLQEQSQMLNYQYYRWSKTTLPYARILVDAALAKGSRPILYETWGSYNGNGFGDTYEYMQSRLHTGYARLGELVGAEVCEVGQVWKKAVEYLKATENDHIALYFYDGKHPSHLGHYIVANTFYACIYGKSPNMRWRHKKVHKKYLPHIKKWIDEVILS